MEIFTMIAVIVTVSCVAGVCNNYLQTKKKHAKLDHQEGIETELDELRERIEILEKIVTDEKYQLHRELTDLERRA